MFHFVTGGVTPAALGADWLTSVLDQNAFAWVNTPLASRLETVALDWLKDLFGLPASWGGILTSGATMANFSALAAARHWYGERHGVDVEEAGLAALPPIPVLTGGHLHPSAREVPHHAGHRPRAGSDCSFVTAPEGWTSTRSAAPLADLARRAGDRGGDGRRAQRGGRRPDRARRRPGRRARRLAARRRRVRPVRPR